VAAPTTSGTIRLQVGSHPCLIGVAKTPRWAHFGILSSSSPVTILAEHLAYLAFDTLALGETGGQAAGMLQPACKWAVSH